MSYFLSPKYDDLRMPTEIERQKLCQLMWIAFIEMRRLCWENKNEQAADLADAFHNLLSLLYSENFSMKYFRLFLEGYHLKYPKNETGGNFIEMLEKIINDENL